MQRKRVVVRVPGHGEEEEEEEEEEAERSPERDSAQGSASLAQDSPLLRIAAARLCHRSCRRHAA